MHIFTSNFIWHYLFIYFLQRNNEGESYSPSYTPTVGTDGKSFLLNPNVRRSRVVIDERTEKSLGYVLPHIGCHAIDTTGDGFCLNHAVSTSLYGTEMFYMAIRKVILNELEQNEVYYRAFMNNSFDAFPYDSCTEIAKIVDYNSDNPYSPREHFFVLANALKRPIITFEEKGLTNDQTSIYTCIFLPLRHIDPNECCKYPLLIGILCSRNPSGTFY